MIKKDPFGLCQHCKILMGDIEFAECQPVLEDEFKDVIYKKGQK